MQNRKIYLFLIPLCLCLLFSGCGKKSQAAKENAQEDLFVEYHEYYFPNKIETLALGEIAEYRGRGGYHYNRNFARSSKKRRSNRFDDRYSDDVYLSLKSNTPRSRRQLLRYAESAIGTPYVVGGMQPGGFDCSGLVCWAYGNVGVKLPRTAREQSVVGTRITRVEDMQAGDIVAFRHPRRGYHTGIYIGGGKFIHSPRRKSHVKINSLNDTYFSETFLSARRVNIGSRENLLAQAERRLQDDMTASPRVQVNREDSHTSRNASRERVDRSRKSLYGKNNRRISEKLVAKRSEDRDVRSKKKSGKKHEEARSRRERRDEVLVAENKRSKAASKDRRTKEKVSHKDGQEVSRSKKMRESRVPVAERSDRKKRSHDGDKHGHSEKRRSRKS